MQQIRPISDLRNKFAEVSRDVHETNEPVFLTKNGVGDMVVMSMESFAALEFDSTVYTKLQEAEREAEATATRYSSAEVLSNTSRNTGTPGYRHSAHSSLILRRRIAHGRRQNNSSCIASHISRSPCATLQEIVRYIADSLHNPTAAMQTAEGIVRGDRTSRHHAISPSRLCAHLAPLP